MSGSDVFIDSGFAEILHWTETTAALLTGGGACSLREFSSFEVSTRHLLFLCCSLFNYVSPVACTLSACHDLLPPDLDLISSEKVHVTLGARARK